MTRMTPLLERNEQFARTYTPVALGLPATQVIVVTCLDHRVDPALFLGLRLADAPVIRNAGGRVTEAVIDDLAYLAFLAEQLFKDQLADGRLFEVAIIHHTDCGSTLLADDDLRHGFAQRVGIDERALADTPVLDPARTVRTDVQRVLWADEVSPEVFVSGHVYDVETGLVTTVVDARSKK